MLVTFICYNHDGWGWFRSGCYHWHDITAGTQLQLV